jgi:sirohydrochlorin cobaltochelatase
LHPHCAYFFVIHGSRDPRPEKELQLLLSKIRPRLPEGTWVTGGTLECGELPFLEQLINFAQTVAQSATPAASQAPTQSVSQTAEPPVLELRLVPLFLLPGVHVRVDIPAAVAAATAYIPKNLQIKTCQHLGSHPGLAKLIDQQWQAKWQASATGAGARILLSHGSRRPEGNQAIAALASQLQAQPAYWSTPPNLATVVMTQVLISKQISIFPYFLFPGSVVDAIMQTIELLRRQYDDVEFHLEQPLQVTDKLAALVCDLETLPELISQGHCP